MDYIVYESNTGFTKQYAEMLGTAVNLPALPLTRAVKDVPKGSDIFFLGWICGGKISGLQVASKRFVLEGVAAVGILYPHEGLLGELLKENRVPCPFFYLQGGVDTKRLSYFKRKLLSMIARNIEMHQARTQADWDLVDTLRIGGSYVSEKNLEPIVNWISSVRKGCDE